MNQDLIKILENIGFTEKEARVYLGLSELGQGTVYQLAKITDLKRPIIYVIIEGLIKRGYVTELPDKKSSTFQAMDPMMILKQVQTNVKNFSQMIPIFRTLHNKGISRPKISYFENKQAILNIYEQQNYDPSPFFISSYKRLEAHFPGVTAEWIKNYKKGLYKLKSQTLVSDDPEELEYIKEFQSIDQKVRTLSELRGINMDFAIFGNKLSISSLGENLFLVLIESEELVKSMKPIFEIAWKKGTDVKYK